MRSIYHSRIDFDFHYRALESAEFLENMLELHVSLQTYIISILAVLFILIDFISSVKYVRHSLSPARLGQPHNGMDGVSLLTCSALCSMTESCFGVGFHPETSRCELFSQKEYFGEYLLTNNDGWRVYSNVIGKFFHRWSISLRCSVIPRLFKSKETPRECYSKECC